ncbi:MULTISPECIES: hypothetical protein [unclassified Coleofasciculus]|uniref:hypothetical protein n=1 Tax=unclassified Coleofasciculus TaxID=2692782 RepID=UPI00187FBDD3|nr:MULTISPECIES: hypothetical protein [unclassified Coleofasciculus]MBE9127952.1 hypothetical protein [Coleofasciculus sp. LEGE 07081]MBE9151111.1 hypothetical protein [Coleofasciculus sp. LEGE 07092]
MSQRREWKSEQRYRPIATMELNSWRTGDTFLEVTRLYAVSDECQQRSSKTQD